MFRHAPAGIVLAVLMLAGPLVGWAQVVVDAPPESLPAIESLIDKWYVEQCEGTDGQPYVLMAPGGVDASPGYLYTDNGSASLGRPYPVSIAGTMTLFRYEVTRIQADARFAKVDVRERGYQYAGAAGTTYERMGHAMLVLEIQEDGRWLVLAHSNASMGFSQSMATVPMPDLGPQGGEAPEPRCGRFREGEHAG